MWVYNQHFRVEKKDSTKMTFDYGVMVYFDQACHASTKDTNLTEGKIQYVEKILEIL